MTRKLFKDVQASTAQVILNQVLGIVIFIITSRFLPKEVYGEFNWSLAILTFSTSILSLRLEQIVVRRVAAGEDASKLLTIFAGHIFFSGTLFFLALLGATFFFPSFFGRHDLLLLLAISHLLSFFSSPFRQLANGKEYFRVLAIMSSISNIARAAGLMAIVITDSLTIREVILVFIISSLIELILCFALSRAVLKTSISARYGIKDYVLLIRESLPQAGVVFLNASIARIDWILLGILSTPLITAEYSFAYKVYELSPFPLLIIAPILLARFSRFFSRQGEQDLLLHSDKLGMLLRFEMIAATLIPLILNMVWAPVMDGITGNKYGEVNTTTFFILSCCVPFLYMNNLLWTVHFAQNRLLLILKITLCTFVIILAGNLFAIPLFAARGAAVVYLLAMTVEYFNYLRTSFLKKIPGMISSPLLCLGVAVASGLVAFQLTESPAGRLAVAIPLYCLLLLATKQLRKSDIKYVLDLAGKKNMQDQPSIARSEI